MPTNPKSVPVPPFEFDAAVLIGRFQPFHNAHLSLLELALSMAPRVFVVLGSANQVRSPRNPWKWEERAEWIREAVDAGGRSRITFIPVRDYFDEPRWRSHIVGAVRSALVSGPVASSALVSGPMGSDARATAMGPAPSVALVGHFKDATSLYLDGFEDWRLVSVPSQGSLSATALRDRYFGAQADDAETSPDRTSELAALVPECTYRFLTRFARTSEYADLKSEWQSLRDFRAAWAGTPYPSIFVTVDAVVTCSAHVLLIRRGHPPAKGALALPGGFLEQSETTHQSALRELREETGLVLGRAGVRYTLVSKAPFDHPTRSQRGRTITHAFHFDLGSIPLPEVAASDDAAEVEWVALSRLRALEDQFFEDHVHILDTFLDLGFD